MYDIYFGVVPASDMLAGAVSAMWHPDGDGAGTDLGLHFAVLRFGDDPLGEQCVIVIAEPHPLYNNLSLLRRGQITLLDYHTHLPLWR